MKRIMKIAALSVGTLIITIGLITACGGMNSGPGISGHGTSKTSFFNWKPTKLAQIGSSRPIASNFSPFVVSAQTVTAGGGNLSGFCDDIPLGVARGATVIFGLGRWNSGQCSDARTPDSSVGVTLPQAGQIGQLTVDAVGAGVAADSGQMFLKIIHADDTETVITLACTLGMNSTPGRVHCEDKDPAHNANVVAGDQFSARMFINPGDAYRAIRVTVQYGVPTL
jgi:hypothetical protein